MAKANDGGPAFPIANLRFDQEGHVRSTAWDTGMTLLDYFAGEAMKSIIHDTAKSVTEQAIATMAYDQAEAMLREKAKREATS